MKPNYRTERQTNQPAALAKAGLATCRAILSEIEKIKASVLAEFDGLLDEHKQMLHLALNEAEALAWQTAYPQLMFPTLAKEKVLSVAAWHERQRTIRRQDHVLAFAA